MHEKVKDYLEKMEAEKIKTKEQHLIDLGICEIEYEEDTEHNKHSKEFSNYDAESNRYFKYVNIDVSDEEYEQICRLENNSLNDKNSVAVALNILTVFIIAIGIFGGIALADKSFDSFIICIISSFISAIFLLSLSEIIKLLQKIYYNSLKQ